MRYSCALPFFLLAFLLLLPSIALAWQGKVTELKEANILIVQTDGQERSLYLYGTGVPEKKQPLAEKARSFVRNQTIEKTVEVEPMASGAEDRIRAMVYVENEDESINEKILREGLGWVREAYCEKARLCGRLTSIEGEARRKERNLWAVVPGNQAAWKWLQEQ